MVEVIESFDLTLLADQGKLNVRHGNRKSDIPKSVLSVESSKRSMLSGTKSVTKKSDSRAVYEIVRTISLGRGDMLVKIAVPAKYKDHVITISVKPRPNWWQSGAAGYE